MNQRVVVMADQAKPSSSGRIVTWAVGLSIAYVGILGIAANQKWEKLISLDPNALGDTIAGTLSPLILGWFIAGFFLQREELKQNTEALRLQAAETKALAEQAKVQARSVQENTDYAKMDVMLKFRDDILNDISMTIYEFIPNSVRGITRDRMIELYNAGNYEVFAKEALFRLKHENHINTLVSEYGNGGQTTELLNFFFRRYNRCVDILGKFNLDPVFLELFESGYFGQLNALLRSRIKPTDQSAEKSGG